jgi:preprotein translocase subunit SecE
MATDQSNSAKAADKPVKGASASKPARASSPKAPAKQSKAVQDKPNVFERIMKYFRDVRVEMQRVVWPNREEVIQSSLVVVVALAFFIVYVFAWDYVSQFLFITLPAMITGTR